MVMHELLTSQHTVLGCMLRFPECLGEVMLKLTADDFLDPDCRTVFCAIRDVFRSGQPVGAVMVADKLTAGLTVTQGKAWRSLLAELMGLAPTAANVDAYADIVREQARLSGLRNLGSSIALAHTVEDAEQLLGQAYDILAAKSSIKAMTMADGYLDFMDRHDSKPETLSWSLPDLNEQLHVEAGDFVAVGGYPSAGKTAFALAEAWHMAEHKRVGFFSLETNPGKLYDRLMANISGVDFRRIKNSTMEPEDYAAIAYRIPALEARTLELIPFAGRSLDELLAYATSRRYEVIYIDYMQLLPAPGKNRYEVVTNISLYLHSMAQRTGMVVIGLSQLTRPEKKGERQVAAPTMASFRESGQIEQDVDVAMLLYKAIEDSSNAQRCLKIAKNKEGSTGKLYLDFDPYRQKFKKAAYPVYDGPAPKQQRKPQEYKELPPEPEDLPKEWQPEQLKIGDKPKEKPEKE